MNNINNNEQIELHHLYEQNCEIHEQINKLINDAKKGYIANSLEEMLNEISQTLQTNKQKLDGINKHSKLRKQISTQLLELKHLVKWLNQTKDSIKK